MKGFVLKTTESASTHQFITRGHREKAYFSGISSPHSPGSTTSDDSDAMPKYKVNNDKSDCFSALKSFLKKSPDCVSYK